MLCGISFSSLLSAEKTPSFGAYNMLRCISEDTPAHPRRAAEDASPVPVRLQHTRSGKI